MEMITGENVPKRKWAFSIVKEVTLSRDGFVPRCVIRRGSTEIVLPIVKLCLLEASPSIME